MKTPVALLPFLFRCSLFLAGVLLLASTASRCTAADTAVLLGSANEPIPRKDYKSWSIFLANNPEWLLDQGNDKLNTLYQQFTRFGDAIGPDNLAVWFWSQRTRPDQILGAIDVMRSATFCKRLKLNPSEGPFVLVTTEYPGPSVLSDPNSFPKDSTNLVVIKLNGKDAASTARLLGELVNGLAMEDLSKFRDKPVPYVDGWSNAFRRATKTMGDEADKFTISFAAGPLKITR